MSENKFEQLIELFIAEDEQGAKDLSPETLGLKSLHYSHEGLVDEEQVEETAEVEEDAVEEPDEEVQKMKLKSLDFDEAELGGDVVDDMIDDTEADEEGSMEADDDKDEDMEDPALDPEDALDELKAESQALMGKDDADDDAMDMDMDDKDMDMDMGDDDDDMDKMELEEEVEESDEQIDEGQDLLKNGNASNWRRSKWSTKHHRKHPRRTAMMQTLAPAQGGEEFLWPQHFTKTWAAQPHPDMKKV